MLKKILVTTVLLIAVVVLCTMAFKQRAYDLMLKTMLSNSVEQISISEEEVANYNVVDARSIDEFSVSAIAGAQRAEPESNEFGHLNLNPEKPVLVYCSIGYRSEKIGERLLTSNPNLKVYNLKGGIFQWVNDGKSLVDTTGKTTQKIHTYNKVWAVWLRNGIPTQ